MKIKINQQYRTIALLVQVHTNQLNLIQHHLKSIPKRLLPLTRYGLDRKKLLLTALADLENYKNWIKDSFLNGLDQEKYKVAISNDLFNAHLCLREIYQEILPDRKHFLEVRCILELTCDSLRNLMDLLDVKYK